MSCAESLEDQADHEIGAIHHITISDCTPTIPCELGNLLLKDNPTLESAKDRRQSGRRGSTSECSTCGPHYPPFQGSDPHLRGKDRCTVDKCGHRDWWGPSVEGSMGEGSRRHLGEPRGALGVLSYLPLCEPPSLKESIMN